MKNFDMNEVHEAVELTDNGLKALNSLDEEINLLKAKIYRLRTAIAPCVYANGRMSEAGLLDTVKAVKQIKTVKKKIDLMLKHRERVNGKSKSSN